MLVGAGNDPVEGAAGEMRYLDPADVGRLVRIGIEENELYIFTHTELGPAARMRFDEIARGYERLAERLP
jgi:hypothetical protein